MKIVDYPLSSGQWYPEKQQKKYIIWHGTQGRTAYTPSNGHAGQATSSIDGWNDNPDHIGTPFLVDRDGTIYRTFKDEREWIYHLGLQGTNGRYDKASIGIEFANELELTASGGKYYAFDRVGPNYEYVGPVLNRTWRSHDWWAKLDEAQVDAAIELTLDLCARHGIPKTFYYPSTTYDYPHCFEVAGILCHANCRQDKTDMILEDWVWAKLQTAGFQLIGSSGAVPPSPSTPPGPVIAAGSPPAMLANPTAAAVPQASLGTAKVESPDGTLNVRSSPKGSAKKLRALKNGDLVDVFARSGEWCRIAANAEEWVARGYLTPVVPHSETNAVITLPAPSVDHSVSLVDTLYEVYYSDEAKKTLRRDVPLYKLTDRTGFFHRGSMQIDVDGSPRAYYPDNGSPLRLDDLSSSDSQGGSSTYIQGKKYGANTALGPRPGFYVSATSLRISEQRMWDCDNFVDAESIPYFVHPPGRNGINKGDVGVIIHIPTLKWTGAIFGDSNDQRRVSEASLRVAVNLDRSQINPNTLKVTGLSARNGDDARNYFYLYFPGSTIAPAANAPHWPEATIIAQAKALFTSWGGLDMVKECLQHI